MARDEFPTPSQVRMMKMENQALELRLRGFSFEEISEEMMIHSNNPKYSAIELTAKMVRRALNRIRKQTKENAEQVRDMELMRLDTLWLSQQKKVLQGDSRAVEACLKIQERRSKLMGLDAPAKQIVAQTQPEFNLPDDLAKLNELENMLSGLTTSGSSSDDWTTEESLAVCNEDSSQSPGADS